MEYVQGVLLALQLSILLMVPYACSALSGLRIDLRHVDSNRNFSRLELLHRAALRSSQRMALLVATASKAVDASKEVQVPVRAGNGEFLMDLAIGTPSLRFSAILDTGSDLIWTQCEPCIWCFEQPTPIFDPSMSSTYAMLPCSSGMCRALPDHMCAFSCVYLYSYGDSSSTKGILSTETFTFGSTNPVSVPDVAFGCSGINQGRGFSQASGLVGLGRGPWSLISQLGLGKFSYCLTSIGESKSSPLLFGSLADVGGSSSATAVQSTPFVRNPSQPSFYYLNLMGISVGGTRLKIPTSTFNLQDDGTGGLIIDSGTSTTYLELAAFRALKKAFLEQTQLPVADGSSAGLNVCFAVPSDASKVEVPKLTFHFEGADLNLPAENYMLLDPDEGLLCLTVLGSTGMSILGNFQQQNFHILYDLENEMMSFVPAQCDQI